MRPTTTTPTTGNSPVTNGPTMDRFDCVLRREHERLPPQQPQSVSAASPHHHHHHRLAAAVHFNNTNNSTMAAYENQQQQNGGSPSFEPSVPPTATAPHTKANNSKSATPTAGGNSNPSSSRNLRSPNHSQLNVVAAAAGSPNHGPVYMDPNLHPPSSFSSSNQFMLPPHHNGGQQPLGDEAMELQVLSNVRQELIQSALRRAGLNDTRLSLAEQDVMLEMIMSSHVAATTTTTSTNLAAVARPPLTTASTQSPSIMAELLWSEGRDAVAECPHRPVGGPLPPAAALTAADGKRNSSTSLGTTPIGAAQLSPMTFTSSPQHTVMLSTDVTPSRSGLTPAGATSASTDTHVLNTPRCFSAQRREGGTPSSQQQQQQTANKGKGGRPAVTPIAPRGLLSLSKKTGNNHNQASAAQQTTTTTTSTAHFQSAASSNVFSAASMFALQQQQQKVHHPQKIKNLLRNQQEENDSMGERGTASNSSSSAAVAPTGVRGRSGGKILRSVSSAFSECSGGDISSSAPTCTSTMA